MMISVNKFVPLCHSSSSESLDSSLVLREVLGSGSVHTANDDVVTLVGFEGDALNGAELLLSELFDLLGVDDLWGLG